MSTATDDNSPAETPSEEDNQLVIYLIVRNDLKMGKGKIAAQCGHAVEYAIRRCPEELYQRYSISGASTKVCLRIDTEEAFETLRKDLRAANLRHHVVVDLGRTQIAPNTPTVIALGPVLREEAKPLVGSLKLLN